MSDDTVAMLAAEDTTMKRIKVSRPRLAESLPAIECVTQLGSLYGEHVHIPGPCTIVQHDGHIWIEAHGSVIGEWAPEIS